MNFHFFFLLAHLHSTAQCTETMLQYHQHKGNIIQLLLEIFFLKYEFYDSLYLYIDALDDKMASSPLNLDYPGEG